LENGVVQRRRFATSAGERALLTIYASISLGGVFAFLALLGMSRGDPAILLYGIIAVPIGCTVGFVLSPVLTVCLRHGPLIAALLFVAIPTSIASVIGGWHAPATPFAAIPASITYVATSIVWLVISWIVPFTPEPPAGHCACGYNLANLRAAICPECGRAINPTITTDENASKPTAQP